MARVELSLTPLPAHVRTARLVVLAAARRAGLAEELVDELRLAVGEATSRAVALHRRRAEAAPVVLAVTDEPRRLTVAVTDRTPDEGAGAPDLPDLADRLGDEEDGAEPEVALAVLQGLVEDCTVEATATGTTVTLRWPLAAVEGPVGQPGTQPAAEDRTA